MSEHADSFRQIMTNYLEKEIPEIEEKSGEKEEKTM
jgi:hypothetical protein